MDSLEQEVHRVLLALKAFKVHLVSGVLLEKLDLKESKAQMGLQEVLVHEVLQELLGHLVTRVLQELRALVELLVQEDHQD